uniref:Uncharacterized protein n=1 Tax=Peronospora matthiolae TaxID=2874970 RepID=A0AAV1VDE4_9STRA
MAKGDDNKASPSRAASPGRAAISPRSAAVLRDVPAHERSSATDENILAVLAALSDRMEKMQTCQIRIDEDKRIRGAIESGMFPSAVGANMGARTMTNEALRNSLERNPAAREERKPGPSPELGGSLFSSLETRSPMPNMQQARGVPLLTTHFPKLQVQQRHFSSKER